MEIFLNKELSSLVRRNTLSLGCNHKMENGSRSKIWNYSLQIIVLQFTGSRHQSHALSLIGKSFCDIQSTREGPWELGLVWAA